MKRSIVYITFTTALVMAVFFAGCSRNNCEKLCDFLDDCYDMDNGEKDYCVEHCRTDYKKGGKDCRDAIKELADCVDGKDCEDYYYYYDNNFECADEYDDYNEECSDWS